MSVQIVQPRRAYRHQVMEAIKSGQYTMEVAGSVVTDFKKIEEIFGAWPKPRNVKGISQLNRVLARDGNLCHWCRKPCDSSTLDLRPVRGKNALSNVVVSCMKCHTVRNAEKQRGKSVEQSIRLAITPPSKWNSPVTHVIAQYEHFGDAIVSIAGRVIAHEIHGLDKRAYLSVASELVSNKNLATYPGIKNADQFEIIIGQEFVREGIEVAFETAKQMLRETQSFLDCNTRELSPVGTNLKNGS